VLDVGCSDHGRRPATAGARAKWLHGLLVDAGYSVLGIDLLDDELEWMRDQGYEVARVDAQAMPDLGEPFDSIVAGELLEHLENPGQFLAGCRRNLKDDGHLILTTPNAFGLVWQLAYLKHRRGYDRTFNLEHTCWYCAQTVRQLLEREGFAINSIRFVDDLRPEASESALYRTFARLWSVSRQFLPDRIRSSIVVDASPIPAPSNQASRES
jgi:2-polyprenyl-3-methyl-5-hydroxy-6-metoxy-1,4-benzoquinol methylase